MDHPNDVMLLLRTERDALRDIVLFSQTATTAGGGGMLGDKYRVTCASVSVSRHSPDAQEQDAEQ